MATGADTAAIRRHATAFRDAVERCDRAGWPEFFRDFPAGCCAMASDLLGLHLAGVGFPAFEVVGGTAPVPSDPCGMDSHAWLEGYGLAVDVTADQFDREYPRLIVSPSTPLQAHYAYERYRRRPHLDGVFVASGLRRARAAIAAEIERAAIT